MTAKQHARRYVRIYSRNLSPDMRRGSMRFVGFIPHPCLIRNPIHFPSLASILGEGLLEVRRIRSDLRPNKSTQDGSTIRAGWFRVEKLPASILEFADRGRPQGPAFAGSPIEAPLVGLGIV